MHINMFCHIHFYRSIGKAAGATGYSLVSVHSRMKELVRVTSREDYFLLCEALIESSDSTEAVQNWAVHKQQPVIASGLNRHCSQIPISIWDNIRKNINSVEQTHFRSNTWGRRLPLLRAIQYAANLDEIDLKRLNAYQSHGIPISHRNRSLLSRFEEVVRTDVSRRRSRQSEEEDDDNPAKVARQSRSRSRGATRASSQASSRASSQQPGQNTNSPTPSQQLRRVMSQNILDQVSIEHQRQQEALELEERKIDLEFKKEELREKRLANELRERELRQSE